MTVVRDQYELALRCLEVEQAGGDVYEYLRAFGIRCGNSQK